MARLNRFAEGEKCSTSIDGTRVCWFISKSRPKIIDCEIEEGKQNTAARSVRSESQPRPFRNLRFAGNHLVGI
jgi:hypothetical protein